MASTLIDVLAPLATPLPAGPSDDLYTPEQWRVFMAIMDTVIPSIRVESASPDRVLQMSISDAEYKSSLNHIQGAVVNAPNHEQLIEYLNERPSDYPEFKDAIKRTLGFYVREDARKALGLVLSALDTRVGSLMLTGSATPLYEQPIRVRKVILDGWRDSYLPPLNSIFKELSTFAKHAWLRTSPMYHKLSGFPKVPEHYKPGKHYEYKFKQFSAAPEPEIIETDVVIVGSGCGGGVCAKNLAEAGHRVLVVDKGYHFEPSQLPMSEPEAGFHLFENGGLVFTDDSSTAIVAGSTWGGGGTVNWSASLQTQGYVRKEWAQDRGLTFFETAEFQNCLDRVCHRMGVSADHIKQNHGNQVILEGARKLGYTAKPVPQNTGGAVHSCGYCTLGCGAAEKQGPVVSWLPDAAKAGAEFIEGFQVEKVEFDESSGGKRATGIKGVWTSRDSNGRTDGPVSDRTVRQVVVKAKRVVISCGSLWSPVILLNSGLQNWQIGRNLYLHPVNVIAAVYKEDIRPWEGGILTSVCSSFENLDGHGHGAKLEANVMLPSWFLPLMNWDDGLQYKTQCLKFRHTNGFISICRDRDPGRVWVDPISGKPRVEYTPSAFDRANIMEGNVALAKIAYVTGAVEIHASISGVKPFVRDPKDIVTPSSGPGSDEGEADPGITDPRFCDWLQEMRRIGNKPPGGSFAVAHQMGSNRMSVREKDGVVDPKGRVWGTDGLYVCDASVFPSASGVNPMITNMAISDWISRGISRELKADGKVGGKL